MLPSFCSNGHRRTCSPHPLPFESVLGVAVLLGFLEGGGGGGVGVCIFETLLKQTMAWK